MPNLHSRTLRLASALPVGDPTRRKLLAALKGAKSTYTMLLFSNARAASTAGGVAYAAEEAAGGNWMRAEAWANVDKKTGEYTSGSGGHANAVLLGGDVPKLIAAMRQGAPRLKFLVFDNVESAPWNLQGPALSVDLRKGRRP
jgi:hypothetical protein